MNIIALSKRLWLRRKQSKDVGIFIVDGEAMCKRYIDTGEKIILVPDNRNFERKYISDENVLLIQGKVVDIDLV